MSQTHAHPSGLQASWWATRRTSTSSSSSYGPTGGLLDISNRPHQRRDTNTRQDRPRPRMRQQPPAPLGTREDVETQDYVSPVGAMFNRAFERYRTAEETRRQALQADLFHATSNENFISNPLRSRTANFTDNFANPRFPDQLDYAMTAHHGLADSPWLRSAHAELQHRREGRLSLEQIRAGDAMAAESVQLIDLARQTQALDLDSEFDHGEDRDEQPSTPAITFDTQHRPSPTPSEDMYVNIACTICREHPINIILLPCRHACMCNWCADLCVPTRRDSPVALPPTPGESTGRCPKCRKTVRERREIFLG